MAVDAAFLLVCSSAIYCAFLTAINRLTTNLHVLNCVTSINKNQAIFAFDLEKELGGLNENTFAVKIGAEYWIAKVVAGR